MPPKNLKKRRRGEVARKTTLSKPLILQSPLKKQQNSLCSMEHLLNGYDFDLNNLRQLLLENGLNVSFSRVKYRDIAPRVGLEPALTGRDMKAFKIHRACISTSLFKEIVVDLDIAMYQYGDPVDHDNVEARSRCLAPLFNRTVALFKSTIRNNPEPTMPIVCGGTSFEFFSFNGGTSPPTFSRGVYRTLQRLSLADYGSTSGIDYMRSLRPICEVLFYFLLLAYGAGVRAYMLRSLGDGTRANRPRDSTPGWTEADKLATLALSHAICAALRASTLHSAADEQTEYALKCLQQSLEAIPASHKKNSNLLSSWDEEQLKDGTGYLHRSD